MAIIVIKDLPENIELDRQAMLAVIGGSRFRAGGGIVRPVSRRVRLYDLSPGAGAKPAAPKPLVR